MEDNSLYNNCAGTAAMLAEALHGQLGVDHDKAQEIILQELLKAPSPIAREQLPNRPAAGKTAINVGPLINQVSPVAYWYRHGHFQNQDEARGAFRLAYQQGMDGLGMSVPHWMGITEAEYAAWMRDDTLPPLK